MAFSNYNDNENKLKDTTDLSEALSTDTSSYESCSGGNKFRSVSTVMKEDNSYHTSLEMASDILPRYFNLGSGQIEKKAVHMFDMRLVRYLSYGREVQLKCKSMSKDDITAELSTQLKVDKSCVHVIEHSSQSEEAFLLTKAVVVPETLRLNGQIYLLVDLYSDNLPVQTLCVRLALSSTLEQSLQILEKELKCQKLCLCKNGLVLPRERKVQSLGLLSFEQVQLVDSQTKMVRFLHHPRSGAEFMFTLEIDTTWCIRQVKQVGLEEFGDLVPASCQSSMLHLVSDGTLLQDDQCVGLWLGCSRTDILEVHFSNGAAIAVIIKFKDGRNKCMKQMVVPLDCSTETLRNLIGQSLNVDPKAVRLVLNNVRLDEYDNLKDVLHNGCVIAVGIKKRKRLRIKNPQTLYEMTVEMYLLESVYLLKKKVSEAMGVDMLNFRLYCREIEMKEKNLLQTYALKNNMLLKMDVYENRLLIQVVIVFKHVRQNLIIDDPNFTTVGDLLHYCGHRYDYDSDSSRAIYGTRCLDPNHTLEREGIESRQKIVIVHFRKSEHLKEGLRSLFEVHPDGQVNHGYATVVSGVLCVVFSPSQHLLAESSDAWNNGRLPEGIHMYKHHLGQTETVQKPREENAKEKRHKETTLSCKRRQELLDKFLPQARAVCERRQIGVRRAKLGNDSDSDITRVKQVYRCPGKERRKISVRMAELSNDSDSDITRVKQVYRCPGKERRQISGRMAELSNDSDSDITRVKQVYRCPGKESSPDFYLASSDEFDTDGSMKFQTNIIDKSNSEAEMKSNFKEEIPLKQYGSKDIEPSGFCSDSMSSNDSKSKLKSLNEQEIAVMPRELHNLHHMMSDSGICLDNFRDQMQYLVRCPYIARKLIQRSRRRTCTTGDIENGQDYMVMKTGYQLQHSSTFPQLLSKQQDEFLNTGGITRSMLVFISQNTVRHWRKLARQLGVEEGTIDFICERYPNDAHEACFQLLVTWKRQTGTSGTRDRLVHALETVGLRNIAETINGYHTT